METVLIAIGTLVPMLLILVVVHEFGHFATARAMGVKVLEFGVGFPPRAFGFYTGNTKVLMDSYTRFVNLQGPGDLRIGQVIKVYSSEDPAGNLVARVIDASGSSRRSKRQDSQDGDSPERSIPDGVLKHDGKVNAVEPGGGSLILADMLYSVNWAPLGGFVRLAGESDPNVPRSLASKGTGTRFLVLVAGPLMNAILPIVVLSILFMVPRDVAIGRILVSEVNEDSAASAAGLQIDDIVVEADGKKIENRFDLDRSIFLNGGSTMEWLILRDGVSQVVRVKPRFERPAGRWVTGIGINETGGRVLLQRVEADSPAEVARLQPEDVVLRAGGQNIQQVNDLRTSIQASEDSEMDWLILRGGRELLIQVTPRFDQSGSPRWFAGISTALVDARVESRSEPIWKAIPQGFVSTWESLLLMKQAMLGAFSTGSDPGFSGPIGIAQLTGEVTRDGGFTGWLTIAVLLSINLAILNILPIPMLDGGRLVFVILEWLRRGKRVPPEREGLIHLIGFVLLISAVLVISANDINRLIQGGSLLGG
jgi:regulator of sigma E protease